MPDLTRKVRVSPEVMDRWWTRDHDGNRLRVTWGEPDADGFYEPTITVDYADNLIAAELARIRAAVEGLPGAPMDDRYAVIRAAVLAILDGEAAPAAEGHQLHRVPQAQDTEETP